MSTEQTGSNDPTASANGSAAAVEQAAAANPADAGLVRAYFRRVEAEDQPWQPDGIGEMVAAHRELGAQRYYGEALVRIYNPTAGEDGWGGTSTAVDVVNDDMPYLVESVIAALTDVGVRVHRVIHPILAVRRDDNGSLTNLLGVVSPRADPGDATAESWMHLLVDRLSDDERQGEVSELVHAALRDTRAVVADSGEMKAAADDVARQLGIESEPAELLAWLAAGNATFLGYRSEPVGAHGSDAPTALGLLRTDSSAADGPASGAANEMTAPEQPGEVLNIGQCWLDSALGRDSASLSILVTVPDSTGEEVQRHQFLVGLTSSGRYGDITAVPVLRGIVTQVLAELGAAPNSYSGQRALDALASYPRSELFWADLAQVTDVVAGQLQLSSRRRLRVFLQPDPQRRFVSVLVFLPRDRYTTARRLAMQEILVDWLGGSAIRYTARVGGSLLASVHFTITTTPDDYIDVDLEALTTRLREAVRSWDDRLVWAVVGGDEDLDTAEVLSRYADAFDEAYKEDYEASDAVADLSRLDALSDADDLDFAIEPPPPGSPGVSRMKLYVTDSEVTLSQAMPMLQSMGVNVIDERPYSVRRSNGTPARIYDFGVTVEPEYRTTGDELRATKERFVDAFAAVWRGHAEIDGFNTLVLAARLAWRDVAIVRAYAKYLRQIGSAFTQGYIEQVLLANPGVTRALVDLFTTRFDPDLAQGTDRAVRCDDIEQAIVADLDQVASLDADRILRTYLRLILATDRTNAYQTDDGGAPRETLAFKLNPARVPGIPKPVPAYEIWVYSPRVEGVHLRFGAVARGGLRWSDRPEDFRTEVLGLVKAQEVKNAIIVPVGAKGGFVVKHPPTPSGDATADRDAARAEGIECYQAFISCLLDVTDNRIGADIVPPDRVVRHDEDDSYMVVAADKGTATFSDIANAVSADYQYWLGDAFASGGSAGYDHKEMGITARGAWESVKHHFRELGIDTQHDRFTCVGVGDMSGDVFGNGMLRSEHILLVGAFDHRHIFIDPDPDATRGFAERQRLYDLPRSSWGDYRAELISAGGGVWPRSAKSIPISPQMRESLGLADDVTALPPTELIRAILLAPVDLLWNGGIGTYVKAVSESDASVGNKANDAVRVNGIELRAKVVGEGGNLGVTQLGRIEYARAGGKLNTDAIDNSAGVDSSDHEVNIKIALQPLLRDRSLTLPDRNSLLVQMTDEVAALVLEDNKAQNRLLGVSRQHAGPMLSVHARHIDDLVEQGLLDREIEFLPGTAEIDDRIASGEGLSSPELSVLIAYTKAQLATEMLAGDLPSNPVYQQRLLQYFPPEMADRYGDAIARHPLAREIVTTMTVNEVVNRAGITYAFRLGEEIAASPTDAITAFTIVSTVFGLPGLVDDLNAADHEIPADCQDRMTLLVRRVLDRAVRWFLSRRPQPLDVQAEIDRYTATVHRIIPEVPALLRGVERDSVAADIDQLRRQGATQDLASRVAYSLYEFAALDVTDVAAETGRDVIEVAALYYAISAHLGFDQMLTMITELPRGDRWHALARQALRDDIYTSMRRITADVLSTTESTTPADQKIEQWEEQNASRLARARATLGHISDAGAVDLAALSVAAREVRAMIR